VGTTIQLDKKTRDRLKELKLHPRESYDKVVERLLALRTDEGELSEETIRDIEQSLEDVKAGRTMSMKDVKQRLKNDL
jgi:predicted transcriptional regulator